ncbi:MAG: class I SAM-dependent methyltransferase [Pyrinomonadaceae bacterium]|nr:class I SAM-dependent methyltransferase [Pyrinomonadaceae bacterium]
MNTIAEDFDRIALLTERHGGANDVYHDYVRRHLPRRCENALEIGCGIGEFTRLLAARARRVVAVDLSPQMIRLARQQSSAYSNIEYVQGDAMRLSLPAGSYDCIVSLATLHHLEQERALLKMKEMLKPNGVLIIQDLVADDGPLDRVKSAMAYPLSVARRLWKTGRLRAPREVREAWAEHGKGDVYLTLSQVRDMCRQHLPEAMVHRHLLWRYTIVWHKRRSIA